MLEVKDLWVGVDGKEILKGVDLAIGDREKHVLFLAQTVWERAALP